MTDDNLELAKRVWATVSLGPMLSEYVKSGGPGGGARRQG
jgi:hypothetical protein